jgi:hypothetical protein
MGDQAFDPKGKTFEQRLKAFQEAAQKDFHVKIGVTSGDRSAETAQKWHIAHMLLFNAYKSVKPKSAKINGEPIPWSHFSDPGVTWSTVTWQTFLRTKTNAVAEKDSTGKAWAKGKEPDEAQTRKRATAIVTADGVGPANNRGSAMVAPGIAGCGEPCKCGLGRSKHISGAAADLSNLATLKTKLANAKPPQTLDGYLKMFGLHRPLLNARPKEEWHVEVTG